MSSKNLLNAFRHNDKLPYTISMLICLKGFNYVAEDPHYTFECCGVVTEWVVVPGNEGTIQLQVWRRLSDNSYEMIGENYCIITG